MKKLLLLVAATMLVAAPANAVTLGGQNWTFSGVDNLTLTPVVPGGNQPLNIQCIICGAHQPQQQADFGYTDFKNSGNATDLLYFSTNVAGGADPGLDTVGTPYNLSFLQAYLLAVGDTSLKFSIGIDVNDTNKAQTLESFFLLNLTTHTVLAALTDPVLLTNANNGTGFPDYTLTGFDINFGTDVHLGDQLIFFSRISGANDGPDSFFIIAQGVAETPVPAVGAGVPGIIAGMAAILAWRRRRQKAKADGLLAV